jgi:aspartokinase-like uncharacterized kinase
MRAPDLDLHNKLGCIALQWVAIQCVTEVSKVLSDAGDSTQSEKLFELARHQRFPF